MNNVKSTQEDPWGANSVVEGPYLVTLARRKYPANLSRWDFHPFIDIFCLRELGIKWRVQWEPLADTLSTEDELGAILRLEHPAHIFDLCFDQQPTQTYPPQDDDDYRPPRSSTNPSTTTSQR